MSILSKIFNKNQNGLILTIKSNIPLLSTNNYVDVDNVDVGGNIIEYAYEKRKILVGKISDQKTEYDNYVFLKMVGFEHCENVRLFSDYNYEKMAELLKMFKKSDTSYLKKYPSLIKNDLVSYCRDKNLIIYNKKDYNGKISDEYIQKLKTVLDKIKKNVDFFDFFLLERKLSTSFFKYKMEDISEDDKGYIQKNINEFLNNKNGGYCNFEYYRLYYKPIYIAENKDRSEGFYYIEIYDGIFTILFDWDDNGKNKEKALNFKEFVNKNKIEKMSEVGVPPTLIG